MTTMTAPIINKIRKLRALAGDSGSSEAEAASAARIARNLMLKHALEESDLDAEEKRADPLDDIWIETGTTAWRRRLIGVVARHCNGDVLYYTRWTDCNPGTKAPLKGGFKRRKFARAFGHASDLAILGYLYEVAERLVMKAAKDWREAEWRWDPPSRRQMNSFRMGAVNGLSRNLREQRLREADTREGEEAALVLANRHTLAVNHRKVLVPIVSAGRGTTVNGSNAGFRAGKNLSLNKGLTQRSGHRMLEG